MQRTALLFAGISGALAVAMGAFGAHALKEHLSDYQISIWNTGVQYQFYHTLALCTLGLSDKLKTNKFSKWAIYLFIAGIVLFSGSLYLLASRDLTGFEQIRFIGPLTPVGGMCFIFGWLSLARVVIQERW